MSGSIHPEYANHVKVQKLKEMDEEDSNIMDPRSHQRETQKFDNFGEYDYIPIPEDRKEKITNAVESLHEVTICSVFIIDHQTYSIVVEQES